MRTARVYESPNTIPEFGRASHVGTEAVYAPETYRNRVGQKCFVCNPYWMQHLVRPCLFNHLGKGNKVGSPVLMLWGLPTTGAGHCP